jgi:peptidoglycan/xylan/chitin deacetylase (PgdA/CDA1 family)
MTKTLAMAALDVSGISRLLSPIYSGRGLIFCGHRVLRDDEQTLVPGNAVSASQLERLIVCVRRMGWEFVPLDELPDELGTQSRRRKIACLTFDDGFADNLRVALPILEAMSVPVSIFPVVDFIRRTEPPAFQLLEWLILKAPCVHFELPGEPPVMIVAETLEAKRHAFNRLLPMVFSDASLRSGALAEAVRAADLMTEDFWNATYLSIGEVQQLSAAPGVAIGAHSLTHPRLATLSEATAHEELLNSRQWLMNLTGRGISQVAYPFGSAQDCGQREYAMAKAAGYTIGVTTRAGNLYKSHRHALLALPRVTISMVPHAATDHFTRTSLTGARNAILNRMRRVAP